MAEQIDVRILAQVGELAAGMREATEKVESIGGAVRSVTSLFTGLGEAMAAAFAVDKVAEFAEHMAEMGEEANHTAAELGMTVSQVSDLTIAFEQMGMNQEQATSGLQRLSRNIETAAMGSKTTAAAFEALGFKQEDIRKLSPNDVLERMADVFSKTENGTQKTAIAMTLLGRTGAQMIPFLNEGREGLEHFRQIGEETGSAMTGPMAEGMEQTALGFHTLGLATKGVGITLFEALKPAIDAVVTGITNLVEWFNNAIKTGGELNSTLSIIVRGFDFVLQVLEATVLGFRTLFTAVSVMANAIGTSMLTLGKVIYDALTGHWGDIKADWGAGVSEIVDQAKDKFEGLIKAAQETHDSINGITSNLSGAGIDTTGGSGGSAAEGGKGKIADLSQFYSAGGHTTRLTQWKAELDQMKDAEGVFGEFSKAQEAQFWEQKLQLAKKGSKEYAQVFHEMITAKRAAAAQEMSVALSTLQDELTAAKNNETEQKQIMAARVAMVKAAYGEDSREYAAAVKEKERLDQDWQKKHGDMAIATAKASEEQALRGISMARDHAKALVDQHQITAVQLTEIEKTLADQEYKIKEDYLQRRLALEKQYGQDPASVQATQASIAAIYDDHAKQMIELSDKAAKATQDAWTKAFQPITQAFDNSAKGIVMGTTTMQKALSNIWNAILSEFIDKMVTQQLNRWIASETAKTAATEVATTQRESIENAASASSLLSSGASIIKEITGYAAQAFAGTFAMLSSLMGPAAAAPAAGVQSSVLAVAASVPMAENGAWNVGGTQLTLLHPEETVLPGKAARTFRDMASGKMPGASGGGDVHVHFHGDVYGLDDFNARVSSAVQTNMRRGSLTSRTPGVRG